MPRLFPPCWILSHPRSGSTLLCNLLNNTRTFPVQFTELPAWDGPPLFEDCVFNEWLRLYQDKSSFEGNPPLYLKCLWEQYNALLPRESSDYLRSRLPGLRFVLLERTDLRAQAVSLYFAEVSRNYHIVSKRELKAFRRDKMPLDVSRLQEKYAEVCRWRPLWKNWLQGSEYLRVTYERMVKEPLLTLKSIFAFLDMDVSAADLELSVQKSFKQTLKMERRDSAECLKLLPPECL